MIEDSDIYIVDTRNADHRTNRPMGQVFAPGSRPGVSGPIRTVYAQPQQQMMAPYYYPMPPQPTVAANIFGKVTAGQLVDLVAQIFAALMPLPAAPVATDTAATDVGNLILYQSALASYAKRDEQVRTLGNLVTKLIG
jgi:hypothetical protein